MRATKSATIREILKARDNARQEIYEKARQLEARAESIKDIGYDRPLNATELSELKKINAAKGSLYAAENELVLMTIAALDRTDEVKRFLNVVKATNADLKSKIENVQAVAANVKRLADLFKKLTVIIQGLTKLAAFVA